MAKSNDPVFAQDPKTAGVAFGATTHSTQMDPGTVAPTALVTAGADGAIVTNIEITAESTVTAEKFVFWIQPLGTGNWYVVTSAVLAAYTQAATDAQGAITVVDKETPEQAIRLNGTDVLGVTHHVDQQSMVVAEYTDY